jgi:HD-GYP domain-containing protein (c-di-GMP phosphodiesterase class II)
LSEIAILVLYHQEWYDSNGYHEGLKGEGISLEVRIIAVVIDVYTVKHI